jgi:hypothetical protein
MAALTAALATATSATAQNGPFEIETRVWMLARAADAQPQRDAIARQREQIERRRQAEAQARERARQIQQQWPEVVESFSKTVRLGRNGTLDLENYAVNIVITGGRGDDVRIEAVKKVRNPREAQARALLNELAIEVGERGGNVEVRTRYPRLRNSSSVVDFTIAVPSAANVTVRTITGNVRVTNVNGELRAETASGDVTATGVRRVRLVKTMSGAIELTDGESEELTASTMSGDLVVRNVRGRFFDLQSVTGNVRLMNVEPDRVNLRSMNGDIEFVGRLARSGRYEFQSHAGNIRLTPTTNQGFDIQASMMGGNFRSGYDLKILQDTGAGPRRIGSRVVRATFGDAGAAITAHSFGGDILIIRR